MSDTTTKFTPDELGKACAASITPEMFEPVIRQASERFYEQLLETVQDYLCQNSEYNIASRIEVAERSAQNARQAANLMRAELDLVRGNLSNMLAEFDADEFGSEGQMQTCSAARTALAKSGAVA